MADDEDRDWNIGDTMNETGASSQEAFDSQEAAYQDGVASQTLEEAQPGQGWVEHPIQDVVGTDQEPSTGNPFESD